MSKIGALECDKYEQASRTLIRGNILICTHSTHSGYQTEGLSKGSVTFR